MIYKRLNLKFFTGSEFLLFLFFLLVSCCLWLMLTLNQDYETEIQIPISVKDVPENVGFSPDDESVVFRVRDRGTTLMNYKFSSFVPVNISYKEFGNNRGRLTLPISLIRRRVESQLQSSTTLLTAYPDTLVYYTRESAMRLPINIRGVFSPAKQYIAEKPYSLPDSVWVYAPLRIADTLQYISTQLFEIGELRDSAKLQLELSVPDNVSCHPQSVTVVIPVSPYAEKSYDVPIYGIGLPMNYRLKTFPSRVKLVMNVNMSQYDTLSPEDFEVAVNYDEIEDGSSVRAKVHIVSAPEGVHDIRIIPDEVEFLIEKQ
ncbi:MAG: YbbR-like domain-containing protein [Bacteroidaceae bacterium]|nr:YbbR-like domain-containing protein [Bacteroidaceae bacterium]